MLDWYNKLTGKGTVGLNNRIISLPKIALILLMALIIAIDSSMVTYAWVSRNRTVKVNNVNMRYDVDDLQIGGVEIDDEVITITDPGTGSSISTGDNTMIPGSVLTMRIGMANTSNQDQIVTSVGFDEPKIWTESMETEHPYNSIDIKDYDEIPTAVTAVINGENETNYYYLGTQLYVSIDSYSIYNFTLTQTTDADGKIKNSYTNISKEGDYTFSGDSSVVMTTVDGGYNSTVRSGFAITLGASQMIVFDVVITFEETGDEQNVYQNFGANTANSKAKFSRTLSIGIKEE